MRNCISDSGHNNKWDEVQERRSVARVVDVWWRYLNAPCNQEISSIDDGRLQIWTAWIYDNWWCVNLLLLLLEPPNMSCGEFKAAVVLFFLIIQIDYWKSKQIKLNSLFF